MKLLKNSLCTPPGYSFGWSPGPLLNDGVLAEMSELYSTHYGLWGEGADKLKGSSIRLSVPRLRRYTGLDGVHVASAHFNGKLIGYAVVLQEKVRNRGEVSWVTQFVVDSEHRMKGVGKRMLFSAWSMSDHYAWGLLTANPYAVRALEAATRRRCDPSTIRESFPGILSECSKKIDYISPSTELNMTKENTCANTRFYVDQSRMQEKIMSVVAPEKPWLIGQLQSGWEWIAFTFKRQPQQILSHDDVGNMLATSDEITRNAYSRMPLDSQHPWARHTESECEFIFRTLQLDINKNLADFGCGSGRHLRALAQMGVECSGVDYIDHRVTAHGTFRFIEGDCRTINLGRKFDAAICLYDVVGSYADDNSNLAILKNIRSHLLVGGYCLISVMSIVHTAKIAKHKFILRDDPDRILELAPSNIMEASGNVFDPDFFLLDTETSVVYRKEQFAEGDQLPQELLVRDRRFSREDISHMCRMAGFEVVWHRAVRAGHWDDDLGDEGKELLLLCQAVDQRDALSI